MATLPGKRLGPYEISGAIGSGGMGEVYRARDTRLGRDVAIKVLPESFAADAERLRRFEQEARAVAALNHPNILAVHDIGAQDGIRYIVTELLEGRTLREQLNDGALPTRKALDYARQISDGLAAAHSHGIVHRDLKPENIFCTKDGRIKILDFGLAKQNLPPSHSDATIGGATIPDVVTEPGMVMGTVGYMSPEQVRGATTDHRSDLFSMGAILYEMIVGQRAFKRDTTAETMTAILKEEPPELTKTNPSISPGLERIIHRCMEKEPAQRFQSASDLSFAFESLSGSTGSVVAQAQAPRESRWRGAVAAGLVVAALLAGWFARSAMTPSRSIPTFRQVSFRRGTVYSARLSADGKTVVFSAAWDGGLAQLYVASKEFPESRAIDLRQSILLSVSSSGEVAVLTGAQPVDHYEFRGTLSTMPISGGAPREILQDVTAADWAPDGQSLAIVHIVSGKYRLEYPIGKNLFETSGEITQPRISRDGKMVAFLHHPIVGDDRGSVMVVDAAGKAKIFSDGWEAEQGLAWAATGEEVWFSATKTGSSLTLHVASASGKTRDVFAGPGGTRLFDITSDGRYLLSHNESSYSVAASIADAPERDLTSLDNSFRPVLSNDGKQILFSDGSTSDLYTVCLRNTDGSPVVRLGEGSVEGLSPDGTWALALLDTAPPQVELLPTRAGEARRWVNSNIESYSRLGWLPTSREIIFAGNERGHSSRFYIQEISGRAPRPISSEGFAGGLVIPVSPDGKQFIAFNQITNAWNVCQVDDGKCTSLAGSNQSDNPLQWSADGKHIYSGVHSPESGLWSIELATGHRQLWKRDTPANPVGVYEFYPASITPDGKSFANQYIRSLDQLYLVEGMN